MPWRAQSGGREILFRDCRDCAPFWFFFPKRREEQSCGLGAREEQPGARSRRAIRTSAGGQELDVCAARILPVFWSRGQ